MLSLSSFSSGGRAPEDLAFAFALLSSISFISGFPLILSGLVRSVRLGITPVGIPSPPLPPVLGRLSFGGALFCLTSPFAFSFSFSVEELSHSLGAPDASGPF